MIVIKESKWKLKDKQKCLYGKACSLSPVKSRQMNNLSSKDIKMHWNWLFVNFLRKTISRGSETRPTVLTVYRTSCKFAVCAWNISNHFYSNHSPSMLWRLVSKYCPTWTNSFGWSNTTTVHIYCPSYIISSLAPSPCKCRVKIFYFHKIYDVLLKTFPIPMMIHLKCHCKIDNRYSIIDTPP